MDLKKELVVVRKHRNLQRRGRKRLGLPVIALVGYTNAGKSTLLNRLTRAGVMAENMLFATLDPTTRKVKLTGLKVTVSSRLPLFALFRVGLFPSRMSISFRVYSSCSPPPRHAARTWSSSSRCSMSDVRCPMSLCSRARALSSTTNKHTAITIISRHFGWRLIPIP